MKIVQVTVFLLLFGLLASACIWNKNYRSYARGFRETNHAFWNSSIDWGDIYFDRETGMLIELHRTHRFVGDNNEEVVNKTDVIVITDTNRWQVTAVAQQPFTPLFSALTIGIFTLLVFIVLISRFVTKNTRNRQHGRQGSKLQINRPSILFG